MVLTEQNYYGKEASQQFFSVSQYKDFMKCEAMAMAKIRGDYQQPVTKALLVGSFVDAYFEGTLKQFMEVMNEVCYELKKQGVNINQLARNINAYPDLISMTAFEPFQRVFRRLEDSVLKLYEKVVS